METEFLTTHGAAQLLGMTPDGVRYYERTGRLLAIRTTHRQRLFLRSDVLRFAQQRAQQREARGAVDVLEVEEA